MAWSKLMTPEEIRAANRIYYHNNSDRLLARKREKYKENGAKLRAERRARYKAKKQEEKEAVYRLSVDKIWEAFQASAPLPKQEGVDTPAEDANFYPY